MFQNQEEDVSRRELFTKLIEAAVAIPLGAAAINNLERQGSYAVVDTSKALLAEDPDQAADITGLLSKSDKLIGAFSELDSAYFASYRKSRTVPHTTIVNGKLRTRLRTEHYWDEEAGAPRYATISSWPSVAQDWKRGLSRLENEKLVNVDQLERLEVVSKSDSKLGHQIASGTLLVGEIGLLMSYEEIEAYFRSRETGRSMVVELEESLTSEQHSRRSWVKLGAALLAGAASIFVHDKIEDRIKSGGKRLNQELGQVSEVENISELSAIEDWFGRDIDASIAKLNEIWNTCKITSGMDLRSQNVKTAFKVLELAISDFTDSLVYIRNNPARLNSLSYLSKCGLVTDQVHGASSREGMISSSEVYMEGLAVAAVLAAVVVPGEYLVRKS